MNRDNRTNNRAQNVDSLVMKELPVGDRPYEKCVLHGAGSLSDAELLAVVIRTGSQGERAVELARRVLYSIPGKCLGGLYQTSLEQLQEIRGIGRVKAVQLLCLGELTRRMVHSCIPPQTLTCEEPEQVAAYYMSQMSFLETEEVRLLILDGKNALSHEVIVSHGSFNASYAAPREIYYYALKHKAVRLILLHNHPSGDPTPSQEDIMLTKRLSEVGNMIGIELLDHIVIGNNRYISFRKSGYM
jgi:DNA repair protein RadC